MDDPSQYSIRSYQASDRVAVRELCCETGFLGSPIDPVFQDRELFADFLTTYYTDHEPESSFVLEIDGQIRGYLLGSRKPLQHQLYSFAHTMALFFSALSRYRRYNERSRKFIRWVIGHGWHEVPAAPRSVPHFHINLLPDARKVSTTRALMSAYLNYLYRFGERHVYGQIVTFESRRGEKLFERYGFKVLNRESGRDYEMESGLPEVSLSQHRDQDPRNRRAAFRVFASTNVKRACRPETILSKPLFQGQLSRSPRMNCSTQRCASSSVICTGGRFAK